MKSAGTEPEKIVGYLNKLKNYPGVFGDISFTADRHDGYPDDGSRHGRGQFAEERRVQAGAGIRVVARASSRTVRVGNSEACPPTPATSLDWWPHGANVLSSARP